MKTAPLLLLLLSAAVQADGGPSGAAQKMLEETESHVRELQRLNAADASLEVQLRIARKLQECRQTGYPCTAPGLAPVLPAHDADAPPRPAPAPLLDLPKLLGIYQGRARLQLGDGRQLEARPGQHVGPWLIRAVGVDSMQVQSPQGEPLDVPITPPPAP